MVSFKLGKEIEKDVFVFSRAWDKEKIQSCHEELNLRPSDSALQIEYWLNYQNKIILIILPVNFYFALAMQALRN